MSGSAHGFCSVCGYELVRDPKPAEYSTFDGRPYFRYRCPNRPPWWRFADDHDQRIMDEIRPDDDLDDPFKPEGHWL